MKVTIPNPYEPDPSERRLLNYYWRLYLEFLERHVRGEGEFVAHLRGLAQHFPFVIVAEIGLVLNRRPTANDFRAFLKAAQLPDVLAARIENDLLTAEATLHSRFTAANK